MQRHLPWLLHRGAGTRHRRVGRHGLRARLATSVRDRGSHVARGGRRGHRGVGCGDPELEPHLCDVARTTRHPGGGVATIGIMGVGRRDQGGAPALLAAVALFAIMAAPTVASVATAAEPHTGSIPTAQPITVRTDGGQRGLGGPPGGIAGLPQGQPGALGFGGTGPPGRFPGGQAQQFGPQGFGARAGGGLLGTGNRGGGAGGLLNAGETSPDLVAALQAAADDFRWVAATTGSNNAAGLALSSGESVLSIGGFNGTDPSPTLAQFQAWVATREIHYYVAGQDAGGFRGAVGGSPAAAAIDVWITRTFDSTDIGGVTVYDLAG